MCHLVIKWSKNEPPPVHVLTRQNAISMRTCSVITCYDSWQPLLQNGKKRFRLSETTFSINPCKLFENSNVQQVQLLFTMSITQETPMELDRKKY